MFLVSSYAYWTVDPESGDGHTPSEAKGYALGNLTNYWCTSEVLGAIDDGSFKAKVQAGIL